MSADVRPRLLAIGGLLAMASAVGIGRFIYTPILPPMAESLHLTKGEAGLIASANFLGYLAGAVAAACPRLRGNPRAWLLAALAVSAITTGAMAWPSGMSAFLALRFIGGVASAYALVLASSLVLERLAASGHGGLSAIHFSGVGTGIAVSAVLTWALAAGQLVSRLANQFR
jgi:MFS family permease